MPTTIPVQNQKKQKVQKPSKSSHYSLRLNIDSDLAEFIDTYNQKYSSLNRPDVVKIMLLDLRYEQKLREKRSFVQFMNTLPKPEEQYTEDEMMQILSENDLM